MSLQTQDNNRVESNIPPTEDLMREHGVLRRILLIYDDIRCRLECGTQYDQNYIRPIIRDTALIAKNFIENYHQKLEENFVFPEFLRVQRYVNLVNTLFEQHHAASDLTDLIIQCTEEHCFGQKLFSLLSLYINMYEPHSAREDTVIFPSFRDIISPSQFKKLGEKFEEIEEQKFGENGFQNIVSQIAQIERALGIFNLAQFTPDLSLLGSCDM
jgi:Uncharacterized conserved protein